jgi:MATE family multidrug resistance protein
MSNLNLGKSNSSTQNLTKHPEGSIGELWAISYPLMLSALSGTIMLFIDRLVLARYSTESMNAVASAMMFFFIIQFGTISIAAIAEVFVGQYNGAKQYLRMREPVWQMIWFALMTILIFWPLAVFSPNYVIPTDYIAEGSGFLTLLLLFGPLFPLNAALSAFFIGQGKTPIVTKAVIVGSLITLILDCILVFGIEGVVPEMGTTGAGIATGLGQLTGSLMLLRFFFAKTNRQHYLTHKPTWNPGLFLECLKIGLPSSIGHIIAITGWMFLIFILSDTSAEHLTILTITQAIWVLFSFMTDGLQKGVTAVASNFIGANKTEKINEVLKTAFKLSLILLAFMAIPMVVYPEIFVQGFLPEGVTTLDKSFMPVVEISLGWLWFAFCFDVFAWVISGVLTAGGDTRFIMLVNGVGTWVFGIAPIYYFVYLEGFSPVWVNILASSQMILIASMFYFRYKANHWRKVLVS